jgi:hypothetical protein
MGFRIKLLSVSLQSWWHSDVSIVITVITYVPSTSQKEPLTIATCHNEISLQFSIHYYFTTYIYTVSSYDTFFETWWWPSIGAETCSPNKGFLPNLVVLWLSHSPRWSHFALYNFSSRQRIIQLNNEQLSLVIRVCICLFLASSVLKVVVRSSRLCRVKNNRMFVPNVCTFRHGATSQRLYSQYLRHRNCQIPCDLSHFRSGFSWVLKGCTEPDRDMGATGRLMFCYT